MGLIEKMYNEASANWLELDYIIVSKNFWDSWLRYFFDAFIIDDQMIFITKTD